MNYLPLGLFLGQSTLPLGKEKSHINENIDPIFESFRQENVRNIKNEAFGSQLYQPFHYITWGTHDLLTISIVDDLQFGLREFHPHSTRGSGNESKEVGNSYCTVGKARFSENFSFEVTSAYVKHSRFNGETEQKFAGKWINACNHAKFPFLTKLTLQINPVFTIGVGSKEYDLFIIELESTISRTIKNTQESDNEIEAMFFVVEPIGSHDLEVLLFVSQLDVASRIIGALRVLELKDLFQIKERSHQDANGCRTNPEDFGLLKLWASKETSEESFSHHLFTDTTSTIGVAAPIFFEGELDKIVDGSRSLHLNMSWYVKPGHMHAFIDELAKGLSVNNENLNFPGRLIREELERIIEIAKFHVHHDSLIDDKEFSKLSKTIQELNLNALKKIKLGSTKSEQLFKSLTFLLKMSFGQSDLSTHISVSVPLYIKLVRAMHLNQEDDKANLHVKKLTTEPQFNIQLHEKYNVGHESYIHKNLASLKYSLDDLKNLQQKLHSLCIPSFTSEKLLNVFLNYNEGICDPQLYPFFIELRFMLVRIYEYVLKVYSSISEGGTSEVQVINNILRSYIEQFELAFANRFNQSYRMQGVLDFNTDFKGGVHQLLTSYDGAFKSLSFLLIPIEQYSMSHPVSLHVSLRTHNKNIAVVKSVDGVSCTRDVLMLNHYHLFNPSLLSSAILKEISSHTLLSSVDPETGERPGVYKNFDYLIQNLREQEYVYLEKLNPKLSDGFEGLSVFNGVSESLEKLRAMCLAAYDDGCSGYLYSDILNTIIMHQGDPLSYGYWIVTHYLQSRLNFFTNNKPSLYRIYRIICRLLLLDEVFESNSIDKYKAHFKKYLPDSLDNDINDLRILVKRFTINPVYKAFCKYSCEQAFYTIDRLFEDDDVDGDSILHLETNSEVEYHSQNDLNLALKMVLSPEENNELSPDNINKILEPISNNLIRLLEEKFGIEQKNLKYEKFIIDCFRTMLNLKKGDIDAVEVTNSEWSNLSGYEQNDKWVNIDDSSLKDMNEIHELWGNQSFGYQQVLRKFAHKNLCLFKAYNDLIYIRNDKQIHLSEEESVNNSTEYFYVSLDGGLSSKEYETRKDFNLTRIAFTRSLWLNANSYRRVLFDPVFPYPKD